MQPGDMVQYNSYGYQILKPRKLSRVAKVISVSDDGLYARIVWEGTHTVCDVAVCFLDFLSIQCDEKLDDPC